MQTPRRGLVGAASGLIAALAWAVAVGACSTDEPSTSTDLDAADERASAVPDVAPARDAPTSDAPSDRPEAPDAARCCAPDPAPSGCMNMGGPATLDACPPRLCDFFCSTNWRIEVGPSGCPAWRYDLRAPAPDENPQCMKRLDGGGPDA